MANYILMDYGTGAIMAVPAHDERDHEFAKKYGMELPIVVLPRRADEGERRQRGTAAAVYRRRQPAHQLRRFQRPGLPGSAAEDGGIRPGKGFGKATTTYRLRDWGISRQRYWGTPIPMIYCAKDGIVPVPEDQLPVLLPEMSRLRRRADRRWRSCRNSSTRRARSAADRRVARPTRWTRSWIRRGISTATPIAKNDSAPFNTDTVEYWFPIDQYIGGIEHAILHLIYSRFWTKVMRDIGMVKNVNQRERLFTQGMVIKNGAKMSKSKGNVVSPDDMIARYGADSTRMYALFAAPPDRDLDWQEDGVAGISRFLSRCIALLMQAMPRRHRWSIEPLPSTLWSAGTAD